MHKALFFITLFLFAGCRDGNSKSGTTSVLFIKNANYKRMIDIPVPEGYQRINTTKDSFGEWLRTLSFKKDNHVYLYNGSLKRNQSAQFAVLDIPVGTKDLQQCADAVMRLRAEYLYSQARYSEIEFRDNDNKPYLYTKGNDRAAFEQYLEHVFNWCGSASLEKQLKGTHQLSEIEPGDVFIKGGFPGHAMIVTDVAINKEGKKVFMLAQSYMPAQDIHVVRNPLADPVSPWFSAEGSSVITPEWIFNSNQLHHW